MSNIEEISEQLSAYLDGELSSEETRRVEEMLADDPALSDELDSMREVRQLLRGLPREQAPDGLVDAALAEAQRRDTGWWVGRLARAAVIVLAVGIGVIVMARFDRPDERNGVQSPSLVKCGLTGFGEAEPEEVTINTDNLVFSQREVEGVFGRNSIEPEVLTKKLETVAEDVPRKIRARANVCNQSQVTPNQVRYVVEITDDQMRRVVSELNEIRARQIVSQSPVRHRIRPGDKTIALARAELRDKSPAGAKSANEYGAMRSAARERVAAMGGHDTKDDSGTAPAVTAPKPRTAKDAASRGELTTMPAPSAVAMRKVAEARKAKTARSSGETATMPAVNFRQLVVIVNYSVAEE